MRSPNVRRWLYAALGAALISGAAVAADNFVINDATGAFKVLACTDSGGVCTITTNATVTPPAEQDVDLIKVNNAAVQTGAGTAAGTLRVTLPTDGTGVVGLIAGNANVGDVDAIQSGTWTVQPGNTANTTAWLTQNTPSSASAAAVANVVSTAVETGHVIKNSAGNLYGWSVTTGASAGRVLVHNSTTVPSAGAVTPVDCAIVAANSTVSMTYPMPLRLGTGISISFSTATTCFTQTDSATAFIAGQAS